MGLNDRLREDVEDAQEAKIRLDQTRARLRNLNKYLRGVDEYARPDVNLLGKILAGRIDIDTSTCGAEFYRVANNVLEYLGFINEVVSPVKTLRRYIPEIANAVLHEEVAAEVHRDYNLDNI